MKIAIIGSGKVASALFGRLTAAGHDVRYSVRHYDVRHNNATAVIIVG